MAGPPRLAGQQASLVGAELTRLYRHAPAPERLGMDLRPNLQRLGVAWIARSPEWQAPERLRRWGDTLLEFLVRLERDQLELMDRFGITRGPLTRLRTGCSDPHHGGRTVFRFRIGGGPPVYYKPRDGRIEAVWYRLVDEVGSPDLASPPRMVLAPDCCWVESFGATSRGNDHPDSIARSAGALLALLDLVQAADLHPANLARRHHRLMPIDLETVCHPTLPWEHAAARDPADPTSVLRVGMLGGPAPARVLRARPLADGFRAMYHRLGGEAVDRFVNRIEAVPVRVLIRATERYRRAWRASRADLVADAPARRAAIEQALARGPRGKPSPVPAELRTLEADSLAAFDIPRFTAIPDQIAVTCASTGRSVAQVCLNSGLARIAERRRVQGAADLAGRLSALSSGLALELVRTSLRPSGDTPA